MVRSLPSFHALVRPQHWAAKKATGLTEAQMYVTALELGNSRDSVCHQQLYKTYWCASTYTLCFLHLPFQHGKVHYYALLSLRIYAAHHPDFLDRLLDVRAYGTVFCGAMNHSLVRIPWFTFCIQPREFPGSPFAR